MLIYCLYKGWFKLVRYKCLCSFFMGPKIFHRHRVGPGGMGYIMFAKLNLTSIWPCITIVASYFFKCPILVLFYLFVVNRIQDVNFFMGASTFLLKESTVTPSESSQFTLKRKTYTKEDTSNKGFCTHFFLALIFFSHLYTEWFGQGDL